MGISGELVYILVDKKATCQHDGHLRELKYKGTSTK